ncbi:MAG TPA: mandelate racemase/muconate lactonizing enzyme family protein [Xanthobacteraceae bacterium]|jgi:L-alanine-DL-glutamate epimerase-like enolase superfamily enzyme|nr:mandelate racemase/muconate lactonizing enzyme family protein [Xanthobacteraceae bacterium]
MKITAITTTLIHIPYQAGAPTKLAGQSWSRMAILLVRVDTDDGVTGWGEGFGHAIAPATKATLDTMVAAHFIGRDASDVEALMGEMFQRLHLFGRNGPVIYALSAIDIALWDIAGKRAGKPIHALLAANAPRELTAYASLLRYGEPAVVARMAAQAAGEGYGFIKLHEIDVPQVKAAREAIGPDVKLMCDTNCPWSVPQAAEMAHAFKPFDLYWLEEPVWPPEDHDGLALVRQVGVPIAAGENAAGAHDFRHMFAVGALDIAQPSMTKIGGIGEMRRIAALADVAGVRLVPHCAYFGPGFLASLHTSSVLAPNAPFERLYVKLEASPFGPWFDAAGGKVKVPDGPGLGCDPDMAAVERYRSAPDHVTK